MPPKRRLPLFLALSLLLFPAGRSQGTPPAGYVLVWSDEFNGTLGSAPNPANWTYDTGDGGWGNNELENYTTSTANSQIVADPADPSPTDGSYLAIIAIDTDPGSSSYSTVGRYTSARLVSSTSSFPGQTFQYGWMEARIKVPTGQGLWPAWWMLGTDINTGTVWPTCGEMDIMEQVGDAANLNENFGSLHCPGYNTSNNIYTLPSGDFYTNYHTFALDWQQNAVQFYVDNVLYENPSTQTNTQVEAAGGTWEFNQAFFFLLNVAVGGSFPGTPDATTSFPQTMYVDYVRVYEPATPTPTPTSTPTATFTPTITLTPCPSCPPTATPTPPVNTSQSVVFPNPSKGGPVSVVIAGLTGTQAVQVEVFTTSFRKVGSQKVQGLGVPGGVLAGPIEPVDDRGNPLADGLYYLVVSAGGRNTVLKWLMLH